MMIFDEVDGVVNSDKNSSIDLLLKGVFDKSKKQ
jgi:hypothetical protein